MVHGGEHSVGKRKRRRPIHTKKPMHLTMRSESAKGRLSLGLPRHRNFIERKVREYAVKWGIRIYTFSNNSNHLHMVIRAGTRVGFQNFLRALSAQVALFVTGAKKGAALGKRFWDLLAFTRVPGWGRAYAVVRDYVEMNQQEAVGLPTRRSGRVQKVKKPGRIAPSGPKLDSSLKSSERPLW